jgi:hypothetical protein
MLKLIRKILFFLILRDLCVCVPFFKLIKYIFSRENFFFLFNLMMKCDGIKKIGFYVNGITSVL